VAAFDNDPLDLPLVPLAGLHGYANQPMGTTPKATVTITVIAPLPGATVLAPLNFISFEVD
jgi:hypothetical protein